MQPRPHRDSKRSALLAVINRSRLSGRRCREAQVGEEAGRAELVQAHGLVEGVQVGEAELAGRTEGGAVVLEFAQAGALPGALGA